MARLTQKDFVLIIMVMSMGVLSAAWFAQYGLGFQPCKLCLLQRWPYYIGVVGGLAAYGLVRAGYGGARWITVLIGLIMMAGAGLAAYHAGVEWKLWPGPSSCSTGAALSGNVTDLMQQLKTARIVPCDEAPFRILGVSMAGFNAVFSLAFAAFCFFAFLNMSSVPESRDR